MNNDLGLLEFKVMTTHYIEVRIWTFSEGYLHITVGEVPSPVPGAQEVGEAGS